MATVKIRQYKIKSTIRASENLQKDLTKNKYRPKGKKNVTLLENPNIIANVAARLRQHGKKKKKIKLANTELHGNLSGSSEEQSSLPYLLCSLLSYNNRKKESYY